MLKVNFLKIELKTPKGTGELTEDQYRQIQLYKERGYQTLVTNNLFEVIHTLQKYKKAVDRFCPLCRKSFRTKENCDRHMFKYHSVLVSEEETIDSDEDLSEYTVSYESGEGQ